LALQQFRAFFLTSAARTWYTLLVKLSDRLAGRENDGNYNENIGTYLGGRQASKVVNAATA
jgi:hypothetical protein